MLSIEFLAHSIGLFHDTNILKYDDLHRFLLLLYFFNNRDRFLHSNTPYFTRNSNAPILNIHRLTSTERSVHYAAAKQWLLLPNHIKNSGSYNSFKSALKSYFIAKYETGR